jgi:hypothetical protein
MGRHNDFDAAALELRESWPVVWVASAANMIASAARHSRIVALVERVVRAFRVLEPAAQWRLILLAIAVALTTHVLLGQYVPPHFAPLWLVPR